VGVKVRERKPGEWWIFIDHKGQRKAVKVGSEAAARKAEFLTPEKIRLLLDKARGIFYPFFLTAVRTGLRQGELIGLQWATLTGTGSS
jgi:integrase